MTNLPNILITGTPGTGKTSLSTSLSEETGLKHVNVSELVKANHLHCGRDEERDCYIIDEDLLCDYLEDIMEQGGYIVDFHSCDFFPEHWFDLILVLTVDNTILYDRLQKRGYSTSKLTENVECEIMQVILDEAYQSYRQEIVHRLENDTMEQFQHNLTRIKTWIEHFKTNNTKL